MRELEKMAKKFAQTEFAYIIPPKRRNKSRFQNTGIIINWIVKVLRHLRGRKIEKEVSEKIRWVKKYQQLIEELSAINCSDLRDRENTEIQRPFKKDCKEMQSYLKETYNREGQDCRQGNS